MKERLAADLRERQIAKFVEHDKIHAREIFSNPAWAAAAGFGFESVDKVDDGVASVWPSRSTKCARLPPMISGSTGSPSLVQGSYRKLTWTLTAAPQPSGTAPEPGAENREANARPPAEVSGTTVVASRIALPQPQAPPPSPAASSYRPARGRSW